jgi:hypothetical protein
MPRGIPGSGPNAGRGNKAKGRKTKTHTLADIAARSGSGQSASNGGQSASAAPAAPAATPLPAAATTGRGRGRGRATTPKSNARRGTGKATGQRASKPNGKTTGQRANNGQQRAGDQPAATGGDGGTNGIKIEIVAVPGRGGRPQQSEAFPFAQLELTTKGEGGELVGPSFLIPDNANPDNVLAAARKRHKGKTFTARKMEGGVRIWRLT